MKKNVFRAGILSVALIAGLLFAGCSDGGGGGGGPIVISGTLSRGQSPAPANRSPGPQRAPGSSQIFRAEIAADNSITGKLEDGSVTYALRGIYDPTARAFSMQAPSNLIIFTIAGKLTAAGALDTNAASASIKVKDGAGEWTSIDCTLTVGNQTVDGAVNAETNLVTSMPDSWIKTWTDQVSAGSLRYIITGNSITMLDGDLPPQDLTVVEVSNSNSNTGPWDLLISAKYYNEIFPGSSVQYIGKFYVSLEFDNTIDSAIGNRTLDEITWGNGDPGTTLAEAANPGAAIVVPYADKTNVEKADNSGWLYPDDSTFSPLFKSVAATKEAGVTLKAFSGFTLFLK